MRNRCAVKDRLTKEHRSWNMSRIRGRDTKPELMVRSLLHRLGFRFRLQHHGLPGRPDVVLKSRRTAIFVHGCFWHRHKNCKFAYTPKSRVEFWVSKFARNVDRDLEVKVQLRKLGWRQVTVWECELRDPGRVSRRLAKVLSSYPKITAPRLR
jgi:DNA mismatch endonuclease, patch repair protein